MSPVIATAGSLFIDSGDRSWNLAGYLTYRHMRQGVSASRSKNSVAWVGSSGGIPTEYWPICVAYDQLRIHIAAALLWKWMASKADRMRGP